MMKAKQLFKTHLLPLVVFCSMVLAAVSCANEDIVQNNTGSDDDKNFTEFVGGRPETRTTMDYNSGDFYWEAGDKIYVQDDNNVWQVSNNAPTGKVASFKFKVPGKFTDKASYKVYYPGKNGTNNQVTIPSTQNQAEPDNTTHFGEFGDCGTADAKRADNFHFTLEHQAAILVLQPYIGNEFLKNSHLTKIEIISDNNITGTYTLDPITGKLTGAGTGKNINITTLGSGAYTKGFPLTNNTANRAINGTYVLIQPGEHELKIRYWIKDYTSAVEIPITKELPNFDYEKNNYYDMTANLNIPDYKPIRCLWDAQADYWVGHEWNASNPTDRWQPVFSGNFYDHYNELKNPVTPPRAANMYDAGVGVRHDAVNLCKDCPNANEMTWYVEKGDARFDADMPWTCMGHLRKGGIWLKKKAKIAQDEHINITDIEDKATDGTDWRTSTNNNTKEMTITSRTRPSASEIDDYFFLPALGASSEMGTYIFFVMSGSSAIFWSSTGVHPSSSSPTTYRLGFYSDGSNIKLSVGTLDRQRNMECAWKFE